MGGSGGSWVFWRQINFGAREATVDRDLEASRFDVEVSDLLSEYLRNFNDRDTELVRDRLEEIKGVIADEIEEMIDQNFGGSVAKHTYVDGLSDIDALLILNGTKLETSPDSAKRKVADALSSSLSRGCEVEIGRLAVTVKYPDGMAIQLLPAI